MNEPESIKATVIQIARGKELKDRRTQPYTFDEGTERSAIRRLAQCLQMAAELVKEFSQKQ